MLMGDFFDHQNQKNGQSAFVMHGSIYEGGFFIS